MTTDLDSLAEQLQRLKDQGRDRYDVAQAAVIGQRLLAQVQAVHAVVAHARQISAGERMTVYVADVERALGVQAPVPHKVGLNDGGTL